MDVANIDRYDIVLGTPFMYKNKIVLDIAERNIYIGGVSGQKVKALLLGEEMAVMKSRRKKNAPETITHKPPSEISRKRKHAQGHIEEIEDEHNRLIKDMETIPNESGFPLLEQTCATLLVRT